MCHKGLCWDPFLYLVYTSPIGKIIKHHGLQYHLYADDSQLYVSFKSGSQEEMLMAKSKLELCIKDIDIWTVNNGLKLNHDKSELLIFSSMFCTTPVLDCVEVVDEQIAPVQAARNLGIIFDKHCSLNDHLAKLCKSAQFHLRNISKIRKYLSKDSTKILVHAFVSSKLDYCNSLLYGLPEYQLQKLQLLQNTAACIVTLTRKYDHITPILVSLHWLPVKYRITFKILRLVYKGLNGFAPSYIADLLSYKDYSGKLRSASQNHLSSQ